MFRALQVVGDLDSLEDNPQARKLLKTVLEFRSYIEIDHKFVPNYGERYRYGERISTAFTESAVNQVLSKRMAKKQRMRWTRGGVHHLLQVRTRVLNGELRREFTRWYPGMDAKEDEVTEAA